MYPHTLPDLGYAFSALEPIFDAGLKDFLIDAGGDIRASGRNEKNEIWKVGLKTKNEKGEIEEIGFVELDNESIASSGSWARKVKQFHHLIDTKTGKPVDKNYSTVFVQAKTALESDSIATVLFIGGEEFIKKIFPKLRYHLA